MIDFLVVVDVHLMLQNSRSVAFSAFGVLQLFSSGEIIVCTGNDKDVVKSYIFYHASHNLVIHACIYLPFVLF